MNIVCVEVVSFNHDYELIMHIDSSLFCEPYKKPVAQMGDKNFYYGESSDGICSYGVSFNKPYMGNPAGYIWSSRGSVLNGLLNTRIIDNIVVKDVRGRTYYTSMTVDKVEELLPREYKVVKDCTDKEVRYRIKHI